MSQRALIVIDVQNEYFPGGVWALPDAEKALPNILRLIGRAREAGDRVVFIHHVAPESLCTPCGAATVQGVSSLVSITSYRSRSTTAPSSPYPSCSKMLRDSIIFTGLIGRKVRDTRTSPARLSKV